MAQFQPSRPLPPQSMPQEDVSSGALSPEVVSSEASPSGPLPILPVIAAATGIATFSVMDALMKDASIRSGVYAALLWRNIFGAALGLPLWWFSSARQSPDCQSPRRRWPRLSSLGIHALRSGVAVGMASLFFWGLVRTPMAVGMALSFIAPLIALYLAALFLGEPVTRKALTASGLGLCGVVAIGIGRLDEGGLGGSDSLTGLCAILGAAVLYACNLVLQRHQAQLASPSEIAFFQCLFFIIFLAPAAAFLPAVPAPDAWATIAAAGLLAMISLLILSWAWRRAEAHRLLPVEYSGFIWAALMGWLWFREPVSVSTLVGVSLIVLGCWIGTRDPARVAHTEQTAL